MKIKDFFAETFILGLTLIKIIMHNIHVLILHTHVF